MIVTRKMDIFLLPIRLFLSNQVYLYIFKLCFFKNFDFMVLQANHVFYKNFLK